ncbi:MAG: metal ABC transporter substrate-binding protein [Candidatus Kapabacteria bacterium]|nr:metal ABC transporter substrate-binding protein [Candidatus Kapabacteria bacterium]
MIKKYFLLLAILFFFTNCSKQSAKPLFVASSHPIYSILKEIIGSKSELVRLIPPNSSPHTFNPNPSDIAKLETCKAMFFSSIVDEEWVKAISVKNKISMINMLPKENIRFYPGSDSTTDSHFWTDPLTVKAILKPLVDSLCKIDPDNSSTYINNASIFEKRLDLLNKQVEDIVNPVRGKYVFLFHPSFLYFINQYGLKYGGAIEVSPGKEPTAKYLADLIEKIKASGVKAIFSEPQLPDATVKSISLEANVLPYTLDPIGGVSGREHYADLILFNARAFRKALK